MGRTPWKLYFCAQTRTSNLLRKSERRSSFICGTRQVDGRSLESFGLDVVFPARENCVDTLRVPGLGWIPDFQHYTHSEFFSELDFVKRSVLFNAIAENYPLILLSSESAKHDFVEFFPRHSGKARVARFTSSLWAAKLDDRPQDAVAKYHLPEKYTLVSNQLWVHKNHKILPAAFSIARKKGLRIPLVMTGAPADFRDPENQLLSDLLQDFATRGLADQVHFLGKLPFADLISITRCATVIVQPSLWEGWNTLIEDAKALGRPIICSDIDVHREQAPSALGHFSPQDPDGLSKILLDHFPDLEPGPCLSREDEMLALTRMRARDFGNLVLRYAREVSGQKRESNLMRPQRNSYLYQKQQHALYLWGKLKYRVANAARSLIKREKHAPSIAHSSESAKQDLFNACLGIPPRLHRRDSVFCGLRNWMVVRGTLSPNIIFRKSTPSFQINGGCTRTKRSFRQPFPSQGARDLRSPWS